MRTTIAFLVALLAAQACWAQGADRMRSDTVPKTVIGPTNVALQEGAEALMAGDIERGVSLTHFGLERATSPREEEVGLSNLCAGYVMLEKFDDAIKFCDLLLARNDENWRAYNNRAVLYIKTRQYERADADLSRAEELKPNAHTLKVARAMYMDAVHPVAPEVTVDDSKTDADAKH